MSHGAADTRVPLCHLLGAARRFAGDGAAPVRSGHWGSHVQIQRRRDAPGMLREAGTEASAPTDRRGPPRPSPLRRLQAPRLRWHGRVLRRLPHWKAQHTGLQVQLLLRPRLLLRKLERQGSARAGVARDGRLAPEGVWRTEAREGSATVARSPPTQAHARESTRLVTRRRDRSATADVSCRCRRAGARARPRIQARSTRALRTRRRSSPRRIDHPSGRGAGPDPLPHRN